MSSASLAPEAFYVQINLFVLYMTSQTEAYTKVLYSVHVICGMNMKHRGQTENDSSYCTQDSSFNCNSCTLRTEGNLMFPRPWMFKWRHTGMGIVLEGYATPSFTKFGELYTEYRGSCSLRDILTFLPNYTASYLWVKGYKCLLRVNIVSNCYSIHSITHLSHHNYKITVG
jgi:hypothetical protein